jgi:hypothetical protein
LVGYERIWRGEYVRPLVRIPAQRMASLYSADPENAREKGRVVGGTESKARLPLKRQGQVYR